MGTAVSSLGIRLRAIAIVVLPMIAICVAVTTYTALATHQTLNVAEQSFGSATSRHLALTATDYLINEDVLSLNIMMRDLLSEGHFTFAAIHDDDGDLIAQVGQAGRGRPFSTEITFQNTVIGHLRIELVRQQSFVTNIVLIAVLATSFATVLAGLAIFFYGDLFFIWITGERRRPKQRGLPVVNLPTQAVEHNDPCWLTVKLRPERLVDGVRERLAEAASLYNGSQQDRSDDILITFSTGEHIHNSIRCALLIRAIASQLPGKISYRAGIDLGVEADTVAKQSAYLAGISGDGLLVSKRIRQRALLQPSGYLEFTEFHHSMIDDGEVYAVSERQGQPLIAQQATRLLQS